ncbi:MAG: ComEC/Rec2 family competence protein [Pseudochelatococcus sp.]|jgi:competence protein ComEC|uniref:ComEC/Rec2 family competence protein n=1 Tax=Pseudochelatococcus sp. TaxID=2020869 RepID=UPI003D94DC31
MDRERRGAGVLPARFAGWAGLAGAFDRGARLRPAAERWMRAEAARRRPFLWLPVAYGAGIALYFAAEREPAPWAGPLLAALAVVAAFMLRGRWRARLAAIAVGAVFLGFSVASLRTALVTRPLLDAAVVGPLEGYVRSVEERGQGPRAVIEVHAFAGLPPARRPATVRVSFRKGAGIAAGTRIAAVARLVPPPQPARPGGYDFARDAFFGGIGAVGSANGAVRVIADDVEPAAIRVGWAARLSARIDVERNALTRRILEAAGGGGPLLPDAGTGGPRAQEAAFVAALVTGKRGMIADETNEALRAAGIYHVVSIGGFHMTLVAGALFVIVRQLLVFVPGLAVRYPVRKFAAVAGIVGASGYCVFSGAGIDTQRALFVTLIVMGAILVDRPALSMRNLALAAFVCLTLQPESMLGPSFQMSFAGVAALIALFERWENGDPARSLLPLREGGALRPPDRQRTGRMRRVIAMSAVTTIVAMLATGPFSTYHFQTFNPWGILGNAFGLPIVELAVMPLSFLAVAFHPLGLDGPFWHLAGLAAVPVLEGARIMTDFPGAVVVVPAFGMGILLLLVLALLWACLWSTPLRWLAVLPAAAGLALAAAPARPDIRVDREGRGAAVRGADGRFVILGSPSAFVVEQWLRADGDGRRANDPALRHNVACDRLGCVARLADGRSVAFSREAGALREDCRRAAVLITPRQAPPDCAAPHVIDRDDLDRFGAIALTVAGDGLTVEGTREHPAAPGARTGDGREAPEERPWRRSAR